MFGGSEWHAQPLPGMGNLCQAWATVFQLAGVYVIGAPSTIASSSEREIPAGGWGETPHPFFQLRRPAPRGVLNLSVDRGG